MRGSCFNRESKGKDLWNPVIIVAYQILPRASTLEDSCLRQSYRWDGPGIHFSDAQIYIGKKIAHCKTTVRCY